MGKEGDRGETRPALSLTGISKSYGTVPALHSVDLGVRAGELLTLLGPSGSGKTTLLKTVAGFELPDRGTVRLNDRDITSLSPNKRDIGMVFQNYALFPHMSVNANIGFPLQIRHVPKPEIRERVASALELVGLAGLGERLPRQLSGGQQQRVALARAIVFNPGLLLLDEPFGALDRKLREQMQLEVRRLQQRLAITTIFVTHDQEEALVLSDRIAVMNKGVIEQLGDPREIYSSPTNRFVADFIGESNLMRARVDSDGLSARLEAGPMVPLSARHEPGSDVGLLVRPERPRLTAATTADPFPGLVEEVVYLGNTLKYFVRLDAGPTMLVRRPQGELPVFRKEDRVSVRWSPEDVHIVQW